MSEEKELLNETVEKIGSLIMDTLEGLTKTIETNNKRYQQSSSITNLCIALLKAQSQFEKAKINAEGYGYKYANLESVLDACRPALVENELTLIQIPTNSGDEVILTTLLHHSSGEFISSELSSLAQGKMSQVQNKGTIITYLRRYSISAVLGISTGDDNDGADIQDAHDSKQQQPKQQRSKPKVASNPPFVQNQNPPKAKADVKPTKPPQPQSNSVPTNKESVSQSPNEWLQTLDPLTYSDVQAALLMTNQFKDDNDAFVMIRKFPHYPPQKDKNGKVIVDKDNNPVLFSPKLDDKVSRESAERIFDWCMANYL